MRYQLDPLKFCCRLKDHSSFGEHVDFLFVYGLWFCLEWPQCTKLEDISSSGFRKATFMLKGSITVCLLLFSGSKEALEAVIKLIHFLKQ